MTAARNSAKSRRRAEEEMRMFNLEVLGWGKKRGPKGKQHDEVPVLYCLEAMGKTNGFAISDEISCDILGRALIIKQKSALCGPFSVKTLRT